MNFRTGNCLEANSWICAKFISTRQDQLLSALQEHVTLTVETVIIALMVSLPLAIAVRRSRRASAGLLGLATAVYTVPSLALFGLLVPITGLRPATVLVGLVLYSLTILIRNVLAGLDSVPADVVEAARGMGMGRGRILLQVELPLAFPTILAGIRIATVSTIGTATIAATIGGGGLGTFVFRGIATADMRTVLAGAVPAALMAIIADEVLEWIERRFSY